MLLGLVLLVESDPPLRHCDLATSLVDTLVIALFTSCAYRLLLGAICAAASTSFASHRADQVTFRCWRGACYVRSHFFRPTSVSQFMSNGSLETSPQSCTAKKQPASESGSVEALSKQDMLGVSAEHRQNGHRSGHQRDVIMNIISATEMTSQLSLRSSLSSGLYRDASRYGDSSSNPRLAAWLAGRPRSVLLSLVLSLSRIESDQSSQPQCHSFVRYRDVISW